MGYVGTFLGEAISETYETETETLAAWMQEPGPRSVILDPKATQMGFAWHQEKARELHSQPEFADLYAQALSVNLTETERVAYALMLDMET